MYVYNLYISQFFIILAIHSSKSQWHEAHPYCCTNHHHYLYAKPFHQSQQKQLNDTFLSLFCLGQLLSTLYSIFCLHHFACFSCIVEAISHSVLPHLAYYTKQTIFRSVPIVARVKFLFFTEGEGWSLARTRSTLCADC